MNKLDLLVENQNLRKMLEIIREDIDKHCIDNKLSHVSNLCRFLSCDRCVLGKYRDEARIEQNLIDTYSSIVKIKKHSVVSL